MHWILYGVFFGVGLLCGMPLGAFCLDVAYAMRCAFRAAEVRDRTAGGAIAAGSREARP